MEPQRFIEPLDIPAPPDAKLKSFFWKKIMPYTLLNQPTTSFWEQRPVLMPLDFDAVGMLFRAKLAAKKKLSGAAAAGPSGGLAVIDMKRATSVGVIMSKLSVPHSRLGKAVFELDSSVRICCAFFRRHCPFIGCILIHRLHFDPSGCSFIRWQLSRCLGVTGFSLVARVCSVAIFAGGLCESCVCSTQSQGIRGNAGFTPEAVCVFNQDVDKVW